MRFQTKPVVVGHRAGERGASAVPILVIMVPVLFGLLGFALDLGIMYSTKGELKTSADAMALAAAPAGALVDLSGGAFQILAPGEEGGLPTNEFSTDQGKLYDSLTPLEGHVTTARIERAYLSEKFGVQGPVLRTESTGRARTSSAPHGPM